MEKQYLATLRESQKIKQSMEVEKREQFNKGPNMLIPQNENVGKLVFQNKVEEVNFDALYILKNHQNNH